MEKSNWNTDNIPNQKEKIIIVTGASSGLGKEITKVLAKKNATIIMAIRNIEKGEQVLKEIKKEMPDANIELKILELDSLASVKSFAKSIITSYTRLDILINNAGVMMCPFSKTTDKFEIQMGVNHLGHFALTGLLIPLLEKTKNSRIVATSSIGHRQGNIDFNDIHWEKRKYKTTQAYADSKLANLYFTYELAAKLNDNSNGPLIIAAHPGYTGTDLQRHSLFWKILNPILSQKVEQGVLPTLRAAIDPEAKSGDYYGPSGWKEMKGSPIKVRSNEMSYHASKAKKLWNLSEELTGIKF